jgi:hypothetical protein
MRLHRFLIAAAAGLAIGAAPPLARAQGSPFVAIPAQMEQVVEPLGWTFTPTMLYGASWDDNVLVANRPEQKVGDVLNVFSPSASVGFNGRRGRFDARYDGSALVYRNLDTLNSFDQRTSAYGQRALSRRTSVFVRGSAAHTPTTELQDFVGIPFVRTGATILDARGGVATRLTTRVSLEATGDLEGVHFDQNAEFARLLRGGHGLAGTATLRREMSARTGLVAGYDATRSWVGVAGEPFLVQNGSLGFERRVGDSFQVSAGAGLSYLGASALGPSHADPNWHAGLSRAFESWTLDANYSRQFETSYGFTGTTRNDEATVRVKGELPHGFYAHGGVLWRLSHPLTASPVTFRSVWTDAVFGFATRPGVLIEAFWAATTQTVDLADARFGRYQFGVHVVATRSLRIR